MQPVQQRVLGALQNLRQRGENPLTQSAHGDIRNDLSTFEQQLINMANDPAIQNQEFAAAEIHTSER